MDIDQLRAFCQLAEHGNYRLASEHLFITQSALTKKIQRLESGINVVLFQRGRNGAHLTQVGETLLPEAKRLVENFSQFDALTRSVAEGTKGYLNISYGTSTLHQAPAYVSEFKKRYPDIHITLNDMFSLRQYDCLKRGELQLAFSRLPVQAPLQSITLFSDRLVIAVHDSESIDPSEPWKDLSRLKYIRPTPSKGPGLSEQVNHFLRCANLSLRVEQEADDILTLLSLVSAGIGYTILPQSAENLGQPNINFIPLTGEFSQWDVGLVWNNDHPNPIRERFVDYLIQQKDSAGS
jgi:DNA-binding transcriptional LysR family regulator